MDVPKDVDEALLFFQADLPVLKKDRKGQVGNQLTKYADLTQANEVVLTRLNALGCIWTCSPDLMPLGDAARFVLRWELRHVPSGTFRQGTFPILGDKPMQHGAAITYARRYALLAVTGVIPEDEDDDSQSFEDGHAVARRAASGRARAGRRPAGGQVDPPRRSGRAGPPLPGEEPPRGHPGDEQEQPGDGPAAAVRPPAEGPIDDRQMRKMHALWGELVKLGQGQYAGEAGRAARLEATARLARRQSLDTSSDLLWGEADQVIAKLEARRDQLKAAQAPPEGDGA